jgi:putative toxin-antitoxin system antitoxin component (TIGR02293 family)
MQEKELYELEAALGQIVQEPVALYLANCERMLPRLNQLLSDKLLMFNLIRKGVSFPFFEKIQLFSPFSELEWASFLEISTKSLQRYKLSSGFHFKSLQSEKIVEIFEILCKGLEVFGSMATFEKWLKTVNFALGNEQPMSLLSSSYGKELVLTELIHIEHGIFV